MPYVVPILESVQYTGSNMEAIQQIVNNSGYWQVAAFTVNTERIRWTAVEGDKITVPVGGYLVYNIWSNTYFGMSSDDYQSRYHEIV